MTDRNQIIEKSQAPAQLTIETNMLRRAYYLKRLHMHNREHGTSLTLSDWMLLSLPAVPDEFINEYVDFIAKKSN